MTIGNECNVSIKSWPFYLLVFIITLNNVDQYPTIIILTSRNRGDGSLNQLCIIYMSKS